MGHTVGCQIVGGFNLVSRILYYKWLLFQWESSDLSCNVIQCILLNKQSSCRWFGRPRGFAMLHIGNIIQSGMIYYKLFSPWWESVDDSVVVSQDKLWNKQSVGWWFEAPWHSFSFTVMAMMYIGALVRLVAICYKLSRLQWESLSISFDFRQNMLLRQTSSCRWIETPWCGVIIKTLLQNNIPRKTNSNIQDDLIRPLIIKHK